MVFLGVSKFRKTNLKLTWEVLLRQDQYYCSGHVQLSASHRWCSWACPSSAKRTETDLGSAAKARSVLLLWTRSTFSKSQMVFLGVSKFRKTNLKLTWEVLLRQDQYYYCGHVQLSASHRWCSWGCPSSAK